MRRPYCAGDEFNIGAHALRPIGIDLTTSTKKDVGQPRGLPL